MYGEWEPLGPGGHMEVWEMYRDRRAIGALLRIYTCRNIEFLMSELRLQYYNANCVGGG